MNDSSPRPAVPHGKDHHPPCRIHFDGGEVSAKSIASVAGSTDRKLGLGNESQYEGRGIQYAATAMEAGLCEDEEGFICTENEGADTNEWKQDRLAHPFETTLPNVFAVGDVRADSLKRVASAVGEGSVRVQLIHRALAEKV